MNATTLPGKRRIDTVLSLLALAQTYMEDGAWLTAAMKAQAATSLLLEGYVEQQAAMRAPRRAG